MKKNDNLTHICLKEGWDSYLDNFSGILPGVLAFNILTALPTLLIWKYLENRWYAFPYETFIGAPLTIGMNLFFVNIARGNKADYADIFKGFSIFLNALAVFTGFGLMVAGGLLMLIVPGAIWASTYCFAQYAVLDRRTGIKDSFAYSAAITYGNRFNLFFIFLLWAAIAVLIPGIIGSSGDFSRPLLVLDLKPWVITAFVLKTLVFLPWLDMSMAKAYVRLVKDHENKPAAD